MQRTREDSRAVFINTRCRLQRFKDAKFFSGWVRDMTVDSLDVHLSTHMADHIGEVFSIEVHGTDRSALFRGVLTAQEGSELAFAIPRSIHFIPPREKARHAVHGIGGVCIYKDVETAFDLRDISHEGCAIAFPVAVHRGEHLDLVVHSSLGPVHFVGEVRYCRPDGEEMGAFRVGLRIDAMDRLEIGRWSRLYESYAAA